MRVFLINQGKEYEIIVFSHNGRKVQNYFWHQCHTEVPINIGNMITLSKTLGITS